MLRSIHLRIFLLFWIVIGAGSAPAALATATLDIDADNSTTTLTDGVLLIRYLFGLRGTALFAGAVGGTPGRTMQQIQDYLTSLTTGVPKTLDIDSNGPADALTDGLLVVRYLMGLRGTALTQSAVGSGNQRNAAQIETYLGTLVASTPVNYCQGADKMEVVPWPAGGQTKPGTTAFSQQVYTFRLDIPLNPVPFDPAKTGFVKTAEIAGYPNTFREMTVSKNPCDFHAPSNGYMFDTLSDPGNPGPGFSFTVNHPNDYRQLNAQVNFQPGDVIYVSVRNSYINNMGIQTATCPQPNFPTCEMYFDYKVPN